MQGRDYSHEMAADEADFDPLNADKEQPTTTKKKRKSKNKRRFSDEQVRSLETIFESETKLEPRKKVQVARELGLLPRQVAIWFQNKRARWKSKQIEKNYRVLKANYDNLKARLESVRKDKESLAEQLQELRTSLEKSQEEISGSQDFAANMEQMKIKQGGTMAPLADQRSSSFHEEMDHQGVGYFNNDRSGKMVYLSKEEPELMNMRGNVDGSIVSPVKWCSFDTESNFFDPSSTSSHWWETWT